MCLICKHSISTSLNQQRQEEVSAFLETFTKLNSPSATGTKHRNKLHRKKLPDEYKNKRRQDWERTRRFAVILELRLTVPELTYLFFFSFFLGFTTQFQGRKDTVDNDNVNLHHNSVYSPLGQVIKTALSFYSMFGRVMEQRE